MSTPTIPASELRAKCSEVLDRVYRGRETVVVTRHGRPVARIVPVDAQRKSLFGFAKGEITIHGDLVEPLGVCWAAAEE